MTNYKDNQFYSQMYFGHQRKPLNLLFDTKTCWTWVPHKKCKGGPTKKHFDCNISDNCTDTGVT